MLARPDYTSLAKRLMTIQMWIAMVVFLSFWLGAVYLGGDALNGRADPGPRYLLCAHGSCKEVSEILWRYSYWHAIAAFWAIGGIFLLAAVLTLTKQIRWRYASR